MEKGVSTIIGILLILMMTIALASTAWFYLFGLTNSRISTFFTIDDVVSYGQDVEITIENRGINPITGLKSVTVDGIEVQYLIKSNIIYEQYFNDLVAPPEWNILSGDWSVSSNSYRGSGILEFAESSLDLTYDNSLLEYDMKFGEIKKSDVILTIDVSRSMDDDCPGGDADPGETPCKINDAKNAAKLFVDQLSSINDRIGVVTFGTAGVLQLGLTFDQTAVKNTIDSILNLEPGTAMDQGLNKSNRELLTNGRIGDEISLVEILLSDGLNNCGVWPSPPPSWNCPQRLIDNYTEAADNNLKIYTIGLAINPGSQAEQTLMDIADATGGKYYSAPTGADLESIYNDIAGELSFPGSTKTILKNSVGSELVSIKSTIDPDNLDQIELIYSGMIIDSNNYDFVFDNWYSIKVKTDEFMTTILIDDVTVLEGATPLGIEKKSSIGLSSENSVFSFDNFVVRDSLIPAGTISKIYLINPVSSGIHDLVICTQNTCQSEKIVVN